MADEDLSRLRIDKTKVVIRPRKRRKILYGILAGLSFLTLGFLYTEGFFSPSAAVQVATVTQIYPSQAFTTLNASGYVVPQRKSALASKVTGRLIWLGVEEGNQVKKGQIVARLESDDVEAAKNQVEANVNAARFNLDSAMAELRDATLSLNRHKELISKGVIAQAIYDTALARYDKAVAAAASADATLKSNLAALEGAKISLDYTLIRAPFDGVVMTKNADVGDIVTPIGAAANAKSAVITIADMDSLQVEADVSESNLGLIRRGQPCEIQLDALPGERFRGIIHMIVPTADRSKATVMVKVRFIDKNRQILPEMSAKVAFLSREANVDEQKPRTALHQSCLVDRKGEQKVFLVKGNRVKETSLILGSPIGEMIEVVSGVKPGDQVILNPPPQLKDGSKIKVPEK